MKRCGIILLLLICSLQYFVFGQTSVINDLKKNIAGSSTNTDRLQAILLLCDQGYSLHPDTLMMYAHQALELAKAINKQRDEVAALYYISFAFTNKGLIDSSLVIAEQCHVLLSHKVIDPVLMANVLNQKGRCYMRMNNYKEAIDMGYQVIAVAEKVGDILLQMKGKTLIGWAYLEMGQLSESLQWHLKALRTTSDTIILEKYGILFANLALNYNALKRTDSALYFINKAIDFSRRNENLFALSNSLAIQAQLLVTSGQSKLAEQPLQEVVAIRKLIGDPFYIVSDMSQLSLYYASNGQPEKGIETANAGIAIARKFKLETKLFFLYNSLAENYKAAGNTKDYAFTLEKINLLKDTVFEKNAAAALAGLQAKYDVQRKENTIIEQKLQIVRKGYIFFATLALFAIGAMIGFFVYRNYQRRQAKKIECVLKAQKDESAYAISEAEENQRKRIAAELHSNMAAQISYITSNIDWIVDSPIMLTDAEHAKRLSSVHETSQDMMRNLRETIWALNRSKIMLDELADKLKAYIQHVIKQRPFIHFQSDENLQQNVALNSLLTLNIFRIFQEAVTNTLEYANATQLLLSVCCNQQTFSIIFADNGDGFNQENALAENFGFKKMAERANETGVNFTVKSAMGKGTSVEITGDSVVSLKR